MAQRLPSWRRAPQIRRRLLVSACAAASAALAGLWAAPAGGTAMTIAASRTAAPAPATTSAPTITAAPPTTTSAPPTTTAPPATATSRPAPSAPPSAPPAPPAPPARSVAAAPAPSSSAYPDYPDGRGASHAGSFSLESINSDGSAVRFNPCTPIHVVTNLREAPAGAAGEVTEALSRLSAATGLSFVQDGSTTEVPQSNRPAVQSRYGNRWAPVLIAWSRHGESDLLPGGRSIGEGSMYAVTADDGRLVDVTGQVVIDADVTAGLSQGFGPGQTIGQLLMHELGHVVGLGHTSDASQIMSTQLYPIAGAWYGAGDLAGLHKVGSAGGCLPSPKVP